MPGRPGRERPRGVPARAAGRPQDPPLEDEVTGTELDPEVRQQLRPLSAPAATRISRHLVTAARLLEEDPERALEHARAARRVPGAARIAAVREAGGLAAYAAGRYEEALVELRAARRLSGSDEHLPVLADCERGLGRPERALRTLADPAVERLDPAGRAEALVVAAGAHRDLGRLDAALATLRVPALRSPRREPWVARLRYALADALVASGDVEGAQEWFSAAVEADPEGETAASERLAALQGFELVDLEDSADEEPGAQPSTA